MQDHNIILKVRFFTLYRVLQNPAAVPRKLAVTLHLNTTRRYDDKSCRMNFISYVYLL